MSAARHTPWPWVFFDNRGLSLKRRITVKIGSYTIVVPNEADARLIAIAPELLGLAEQIACMTQYGDGDDELGDFDDAALCLNGLIQQATALVALAAGGDND